MFILICRYNRVFAYPGDDITLSAHLSPETSAVPMEVRWFRGTECIYLYKNGQVSVVREYKNRASVFTKELPVGNVSLFLKNVEKTDTGIYCCQVLTGEYKVEKSIHLYMSGMEPLSPDQLEPKLLEQDREDSCQLLELKKLLQKKEDELQNKTKELQTATDTLRNNASLLRYKETDLEKMSKMSKESEEWRKSVTQELEACRGELEQLKWQLPDKSEQVQQLTEELQHREQEHLLTVPDGVNMEESAHVLELKALLQRKEKELQAQAREIKSTTEELSRMAALLQIGGAYGQSSAEERIRNMTAEVGLCKIELETLGQKLLEKNKQVQQLTLILQDREQERGERLIAGKRHLEASHEPFVAELLEKTRGMMVRMYRNQDEQQDEIEQWIHKKREDKRTKEEENITAVHENKFIDFAAVVQNMIGEEYGKILTLEKTMVDLQNKLQSAETEDEWKALERELQGAFKRRETVAQQVKKLNGKVEEQRRESEDVHRKEIEEIREKYDIISRIESETGILKIILPDVQDYFRSMASDMRGFLDRTMARDLGHEGAMAVGVKVKSKCKKRVQFEDAEPMASVIDSVEMNNNCEVTATYKVQVESERMHSERGQVFESAKMVNGMIIQEQTDVDLEEQQK